ncbi:MAG: LysR family transcriptional regulator [gamma proteobacterium symbiont of Ctena orbiculata]|nr:MAG: LysR family transcriptional regulator [gamma proteobacterium symbiont of Ctena orbiculata]PVV20014.1 MAG: LysR family transcriptional regulator [gamma proteobacterium symbiont of Ctena orbiculata]PVV27081.1 MAG: LysR family transcriptional regulator [gamma proteobacterium symbiont of Ctena orbiculata]
MQLRMDWRSVQFDWNLARAFLVTAEEGSLSAAARALELTQPTLSRQVAGLEEELGVALFERVGRGLEITPSGAELLEQVRAMGDAAGNLKLTAAGQSMTIEGSICISATDLVANFVMPVLVQKLRRLYPDISVELIVSNTMSDLKRREADIAIRAMHPGEADLIARKIGDISGHLYASEQYLEEIGVPQSTEDLIDANFICDKSEMVTNVLAGCGIKLTQRNFSITSESVITQWELVKRGLGIALLPDQLAVAEPQFHKVLPDIQPFTGPLWLVVHKELRTSRRVRVVFDFLVDELLEWFQNKKNRYLNTASTESSSE